MWNNAKLSPQNYSERRSWLLDAMETKPRLWWELAALDAVYWLQIKAVVEAKNEVRRCCGLVPIVPHVTPRKIRLREIEMWENAQLTTAEYRARRRWLTEHLGENPKHLRELGELDDAFRKLCEAQAERNNKIRQRLGIPPATGRVAQQIRYAQQPRVRQASFFD